MNILALDDEPCALRVLTKAISCADYTANVIGFTDAEAAAAYAEKHSVDVAFLDIQLSDISGLDIAKRLKLCNSSINIIFTTGYSEFAIDAFEMHSSGYLLKPITKAAVAKELTNLRRPVKENNGVFARCFGNFDLIVNGVTVDFRRKLSKEMLAYLIDMEGVEVSRRRLAEVLFEGKPYNRTIQSYLTQIVKSLRETLENAGAGAMLVVGYNTYQIDPSKFTCDAYDYTAGIRNPSSPYHGLYMEQYSWSEYSKSKFDL